MKTQKYKTKILGKKCIIELASFNKADRKEWKRTFDLWKKLRFRLKKYKSRAPNFPEGLSEIAFCLFSGSKRFVSLQGKTSASFDTYNLAKNRREQIKASSVGSDLSSFGPKSEWDDLYFLDFYNEGKLDGTFNVYKIPSRLVYSVAVNKKQTFKQQQAQKRRPRFSITDKIIIEKKLKPIATNVKVW